MTMYEGLGDFEEYVRPLLAPPAAPAPEEQLAMSDVTQLSSWARAHATAGNHRSEQAATDAEPSAVTVRAGVLAMLRVRPQTTAQLQAAYVSGPRRRRELKEARNGGHDIEMVRRPGPGANLWILHEPPRPPELRHDRGT